MNIIDILVQYNVEFRLEGDHRNVRSGWVGVDCPKCSPNYRKFRLGFDISSGRTNCWFCGRQSRITMLAMLCGISYHEAKELSDGLGFQFYSPKEHTGTLKLPIGINDLLPAHNQYLRSRGFDPHEISRLWEIKGIGPPHPLQWRIFIPIHDSLGNVVSWTSRSIKEKTDFRYLAAKSEEELIPHKTLLYGSHLARHAIVVVEGPIDAWAIGPGCVATCGVGYSPQQLAAIAEYPVRAICFDSEEDAQHRAGQLCEELSMFDGVTINVELETGDDAATADPEEIQSIRSEFLEIF